MILNDRRRPALPAELVGRVFVIWLGVALLQVATLAVTGSSSGMPPLQVLPTLASLLTMGCAMLLIGRIAYRVFDEEVAGLACLASAVAVPLLTALRPGTIDPHGLQAVCFLFALNGFMAREARYGGWAIGAAVASALALSLDGTVLALGLVALAGAKWLRHRAGRGWLVHSLQALTVVTAAILGARWAAGQPLGCGSLGAAHLIAFAWAAGISTVVALFEPHPRAFTLGGMVVAAGGVVVLLGNSPTGCGLGQAMGLAGAEPLWRGGAITTVQALGLPLLGIVAALRLMSPARDWLRRWWGDYALVLLLAALVTAFDTRMAAAACALAAIPVGWQIREWSRAARNSRRSGRRALALTAVALALAPAMPLGLLVIAAPSYAGNLALR